MRIEKFLPRSPYAASFDRGTDRLVVVFCPVGTPVGQFAGSERLGVGRYDVAAFNCPDAQWYLGGIPETLGHPERFEAGLRAFIASGGYRRVLFCGLSKGAFGAVDFGLRCGAASILAAGLESVYGLCSYFRRVVPPALAGRQRERLREWPALARASPARIHSLYGVESVTDLFYAWVARRRLGAPALLVARAGHFLRPVIEERVGFARLIEEVLERDRLGQLETSLVTVDLGRIGRSALAYVQASQRQRTRPGFSPGFHPLKPIERYAVAAALVAQGKPLEALALLAKPRGPAIGAAAWEALRARALLDAGNWAAAEPIARRLREADPAAHEPAQVLYGALVAGGRTEELPELGFALYRADRQRLGLLEAYLRHLVAGGRKDEADAILGREIARAGEDERVARLGLLALRLGLEPQAGLTTQAAPGAEIPARRSRREAPAGQILRLS